MLEPLGAAEIDQLVGSLLAIEDLPASVHRRITERAEGNPFFLEEIIRKLIDEHRIVRSNGNWRAAGDIEELEIPDSVQAVVAARIDLLGPLPKRALQHAAVVGRVFWPGPVSLLLDSNDQQTEELLIELEDRELVLARLSSSLEDQREYLFKHVLTRDVAYDSLPRRDRARAHQTVASWIEGIAGERRGEFVELLAHHYASAHEAAREDPRADPAAVERMRRQAFESLLQAGRDATSKYAIDKAERLAGRALSFAGDPLERSRAHQAFGDACLWAYQGTQAWEHLREAVEERLSVEARESRAVGGLCACLVELPTRWPGSMRSQPPIEETKHYLELGFSHATDPESKERQRLLVARAFMPYAYPSLMDVPGEQDEAMAAGEEAAAFARRQGWAELESAALDGVSSLGMAAAGLYGPTLPMINRRLELVSVLEDPLEEGDIYSMAAWVHFHIGEYRECRRLGREGEERSASVPAVALHVLSWELLAEFRLGDWQAFEGDFDRLQEMLREREDALPPHFASRPFAVSALMHELRGEPADADEMLEIVRRIEAVRDYERPQFAGWLALLRARRREFDEARGRLDRAQANPNNNDLGLVHEARCDVIAEEQSWTEAAGVVAAARAHAAEAGLVALPFFADRLEGRAAVAAGDLEGAPALLRRAAEGFASLGAEWDRACTELSLAQALVAGGDAAGARQDAERALAVFERLGVVREREQAAQLLTDQP